MERTATPNSRLDVSDDELSKHKGSWVAVCPSSDRVIASDVDLDSLRRGVLNAGEDPNQVILTHVPADPEGMPLGGLEIE